MSRIGSFKQKILNEKYVLEHDFQMDNFYDLSQELYLRRFSRALEKITLHSKYGKLYPCVNNDERKIEISPEHKHIHRIHKGKRWKTITCVCHDTRPYCINAMPEYKQFEFKLRQLGIDVRILNDIHC